MSALAFEWMPAETETTTSVPVKAPENCLVKRNSVSPSTGISLTTLPSRSDATRTVRSAIGAGFSP